MNPGSIPRRRGISIALWRRWLFRNLKKDVLLLGFSDDSGDVAKDLLRSKKLADMVSNELEIRGVKAKLVEGFGSALPLGSNSDANGCNKNRRVEVWIRNSES
jgi:phosphate transport system substrate-binding protein